MEHLVRNARALRQTWRVWFDGAPPGTREALQENFEYFLKEVRWGLDAVEEEWRGAFKNVPKNPRLDEELHRKIVQPRDKIIEQKWAEGRNG